MKRFFYILGVLLVSLLLVGMVLVFALTSDKVETAAIRLVTNELSRGLGTDAHIGSVEYRFPARNIKAVLCLRYARKRWRK